MLPRGSQALISCLLGQEMFCLGTSVLEGSGGTAPAWLGTPDSDGRSQRFLFRLLVSLFFPLVIAVTFSLPSVGF